MLTRILVVDDEENHRRSLAIGLRLEGYVVTEARDGYEALELLRLAHAHLAIIDLMMPGMNGLDLARRLRAAHPDTRVILMSAYHLSERQLEKSGVSPVAFLPKPYRFDELATFLKTKLEPAVA